MNTANQKMNLSEWLSWMEQCHPSEIELGLGRVSQVAEKLKIDLSASNVVTVAGTNGKGSTISYLNSIYQQAGYSVGCYTSPHFIDYNERVKLNSQNSTDQQLCDAFEKIDQARGQIPLTYFEFGTLAALVIFSETKPDLVLLEVGLGGRLDAVNIIDADISAVTTVSIDHVDWLGDNREVIGREKSGIFRAAKPAICGDLNPPKSVAIYADEIGADLHQSGVDFTYEENGELWCWQGKDAQGQSKSITDLKQPELPLQNAATAIKIVQHIPLAISDEQIKTGIQQAALTGRMQHLEQDNLHYWLDVAHNPEAAELLSDRIQGLSGDVYLVLGMLADKDCQQVIDTLAPVVKATYLSDINVPRGQKAAELAELFPNEASVQEFSSVKAAIEAVRIDTNPNDNVIIAGSFFTVSDALTILARK
ncbi:bifunctional tetrahydrofolate synthase/dihydrofolate synthase [Neptuniibacter sp. QD48_55]|uniref:bifunctional tetrahydrofolate synthase/dihydrofolate synthase n=1 Tax=Neptuniibacter sp. QD48_55 TaxID=3398212 RepID=UPI0039F471C4